MTTRLRDLVEWSKGPPLPQRLRVAWAASVCEKVVGLYSPYFRRRFLQEEALDTAWRFAAGGERAAGPTSALLGRMEELIPRAEDEDYGHNAVLTGMLLLTDLLHDRPADGPASIGNAAVMFGAHHLYRQGVGGFDTVVTQDYDVELQLPVYRLARVLRDELRLHGARPIERGMFRSFELQDPARELDARALARATTRPPPREEEYLRGGA